MCEKDKCGSCINFIRRSTRYGEPMKSGHCYVRGFRVFHYAKQDCCLKYKERKKEK